MEIVSLEFFRWVVTVQIYERSLIQRNTLVKLLSKQQICSTGISGTVLRGIARQEVVISYLNVKVH